MLMWICIMTSMARASELLAIIHILREALHVVHSTEMGNSRTSTSGMGNKYGSHAFLC